MDKTVELSFVASNKDEVDFVQELCIICQKSTKKKVTSTETGRKTLMTAANIRKDAVWERMKKADCHFVYHPGNECYKSYTLAKTLKRIEKDAAEETQSSDVDVVDDGSPGPFAKRTR